MKLKLCRYFFADAQQICISDTENSIALNALKQNKYVTE